MDVTTAPPRFSIAAALLTMTPGIDTALVLRTASIEGSRQALATACGILSGVFAWGAMAALGISAVLTMSETAYFLLKLAGALYLLWLGVNLIMAAARGGSGVICLHGAECPEAGHDASRRWFLRGLVSNLLNPKVGVFYVSFLPQFLPVGVSAIGFSMLLASIHVVMGLVWFGGLMLATRPLTAWLHRPKVARLLDGSTGLLLVFFGLALFFERKVG